MEIRVFMFCIEYGTNTADYITNQLTRRVGVRMKRIFKVTVRLNASPWALQRTWAVNF